MTTSTEPEALIDLIAEQTRSLLKVTIEKERRK
jgi:hypothetical protein